MLLISWYWGHCQPWLIACVNLIGYGVSMLNFILGYVHVYMRGVLDEIIFWIGGFSKVECPPQISGHHSIHWGLKQKKGQKKDSTPFSTSDISSSPALGLDFTLIGFPLDSNFSRPLACIQQVLRRLSFQNHDFS